MRLLDINFRRDSLKGRRKRAQTFSVFLGAVASAIRGFGQLPARPVRWQRGGVKFGLQLRGTQGLSRQKRRGRSKTVETEPAADKTSKCLRAFWSNVKKQHFVTFYAAKGAGRRADELSNE